MNRPKINNKTLKHRCWEKQMSVTQLAKKIGRSRQSVYFAIEHPERFTPTYTLIEEALK